MRRIFGNFGILTFFLLNIVLPTVDVITDFLMIIKLFEGAHGCVNPRMWSEDHIQWQQCLEDPDTFCTNRTLGGSNETCEWKTTGIFTWSCRDPNIWSWSRDYEDWKACRKSPTIFCEENNETMQTNETMICEYEKHPKFGISLMIPFFFNYLISFLTWWRLEEKKEKTFLFPLVNMYSQLGR